MAVKFTCDVCGKVVSGYYCSYEGWSPQEMWTLEWRDKEEDVRTGYHTNILCYSYDGKEDDCYKRFIRENKLVQNERHRYYKQLKD